MTSKNRLFFREHTHDGLTGGGNVKGSKGSFTIGTLGVDGTDYTLTFNGYTYQGILTWMEDEDYLKFSDDMMMSTSERIYFRDTGLSIYSGADGYLDIVADTDVRINTYPVRPIPVDGLYMNYGTAPATELGYGTWNEETNVGATFYELTIGIGAYGVDPRLDFDGYTNNGVITWMDDEDYFKFSDCLRTEGGRKINVTTATTTYTALVTDEVIIGNSTTAFTITLLAATGSGRRHYVKNINTGAVTVDGDTNDTIDGVANAILGQWDSIIVVDHAANKWVIL